MGEIEFILSYFHHYSRLEILIENSFCTNKKRLCFNAQSFFILVLTYTVRARSKLRMHKK